MLQIAWFATKLFFKGKLLRDPVYFVRQTTTGIIIGLLILIFLVQFQTPLWLTILVSSMTTGTMMPFLMKDFKMK
jgi:hypothetical protein